MGRTPHSHSKLGFNSIQQIVVQQTILSDLNQYYIPRAAITKYHNLGGLKQQKFILIAGGQKANQGVGRARFPTKPLDENPSLLFPVSSNARHFLTCGNIMPSFISDFRWPSSVYVCAHISLFFFFFKDFICLFLERGEGKEKRGRETLVWLPLQCP